MRSNAFFLALTIALLLGAGGGRAAMAETPRPVVALSPGHGWTSGGTVDPGAVAGDITEKSYNLEVAKEVRELLSRCPLDVHLTRETADSTHTLEDVDEIVNAWRPAIGVSIHVNSLSSHASGTEAWYTVGGHDDAGSQRLAGLLADGIAGRLAIPSFGVKPETSNRHGGLYIHWWDAPSALVELGEIHGDAALLLERRRDFARAVAEAILTFLDVPPGCAELARQEGAAVNVFFPGETQPVEVGLTNDGLSIWGDGDAIVNADGAAVGRVPLTGPVAPGSSATLRLPIRAPTTPGVHRQVWRMQHGGGAVPGDVSVYTVVVPEGARDLKVRLEQQVEDWRKQGEQKLEELLASLTQQIIDALKRKAEEGLNGLCNSLALAPAALAVVVVGLPLWTWRRRRPGPGG